jgi:tetratricopeptide (TPR) repeat protein
MERLIKRSKTHPALAFIEALTRFSSYVSRDEEKRLHSQVVDWETRVEWEQLKEEGDGFLRGGQPEKALASYKKAMAKSMRASLLNNAGAACAAMRKHSLAASYYAQAHAIDPDSSTILENLIGSCIQIPDFKRASELVETLRGNRPTAPEADILQGDLCMAQGAFSKACGFYERALEKEQRPSAIYKLSKARRLNGEKQKSLEALAKVREKDEQYYINAFIAHDAFGNYREAVLSIQEAITLAPDNPVILEMAASIALKTNQLKTAKEAIERAIKADPEYTSAIFTSAKISKALGYPLEYQKGIEETLKRLKNICRDMYDQEVSLQGSSS